jgi:Glycosyltransferase family 87
VVVSPHQLQRQRLSREFTRAIVLSLVVALALMTMGWTYGTAGRAVEQGAVAIDFRTGVWRPGRAVLEGRNPLRSYDSESTRGGSVYPPIAAVVLAPFSLLPVLPATVVWLCVLLAAVLAALRICGVTDVRCYIAACACPPVLAGLLYANVSLLLVLAVALIWHQRNLSTRVALLVALVTAAKLFLWPLVIWLAITRRWRAFWLSLAACAALSFIGWSVIGFGHASEYVETMSLHASLNDQEGVSAAALFATLGLPASQLLALAAGGVVLAIAARRARDDLSTFTWAVVAALLASPIVWTHYFAILLVPIALASPTWSLAWLLPFLAFPNVLQSVLGLVLVFATGIRASVLRHGRPVFARREREPARRLAGPRVVPVVQARR